jgi:hypothetical protein
MKELIHLEKGFFKKDEVDAVVEYSRKYAETFQFHQNQEFSIHTYNEFFDKNILDLLENNSLRTYEYVEDNYEGPFVEWNRFKIHVAKFEVGLGMHEHFDENRPNDIAVLTYLNDDYVGGEIYFPEYDIYIKPEPGDLLTFPDNPNFIHGVKAITSGTRFTAPQWYTRIV